MVISAYDESDESKVAIKKNTKVFQSKSCAKRILREIKLLKHLNHPNIIGIKDIQNPQSVEDFDNIYLVLEYMQSDLHRVIYSENQLSESHIGFIVYQMLCGLKYMHSTGVLHRDLKPSNILVNSQCGVKICDFGLARSMDDNTEEMTEYVVTRWYRAPEVVLNARRYGPEIDVWAVGCIFAEMYYKRPLFRGEDYADQLKKIFNIIGNPSQEDIDACVDDEVGMKFLNNLRVNEGVSWESLLPSASTEAIDLIEKLLAFNPQKRISVDEALAHPFLAKYFDEEFVNETSVCNEVFDMSFERNIMTKEQIREIMLEEIRTFRPNAVILDSPPKPQQKTRRISDFFKRKE